MDAHRARAERFKAVIRREAREEEEYGEAAAGWAQFVLGLNGAITFPLFPSFLASFHAYEGKDEY